MKAFLAHDSRGMHSSVLFFSFRLFLKSKAKKMWKIRARLLDNFILIVSQIETNIKQLFWY